MTYRLKLFSRSEGERTIEFVPYGDLVLPARYEVEAEGPPLPYRVVMEVDCKPDGPVVHSLTLDRVEGGPPVTPQELRNVPVGRLLRLSIRLAAARTHDDDPDSVNPFGWPDEVTVTEAERGMERVRRRRTLTPALLAEVAEIYREASGYRIEGGVPAPTVEVARHFDISRATAGRWVTQARRQGLLPGREVAAEERRAEFLGKTTGEKTTRRTK